MTLDRRHILATLAAASLAACASNRAAPVSYGNARVQPVGPGSFPEIGFSDWTDAEPEYLLYPGDDIDIATPSAVELNRQVKIGPDGRIALPLIGQVLAADRTISELEYHIAEAYASQLVRPNVEITLRQAGPLKVWVDGEVRNPGVYDMPGEIDAYQALVLAGGVLPTGRAQEVALVRRGPGNVRMLRPIDLRARRAEVLSLRRGDVLYVPRTRLAEIAFFFTQIRDALPVGFNYTINGQFQQF
jgi:polysaccharide biosynthesis/export protein PslD